MMNKIRLKNKLVVLVGVLTFIFGGSFVLNNNTVSSKIPADSVGKKESYSLNINYPREYDGKNQEIVLNNNQPTFNDDDLSLSTGVWQTFSDRDNLNRVGVANALIGKESFPTEERAPKLYTIPTGWHQKRTGTGVNDWFYNRSHLIGHQLTGENDNQKNLMTGTRQFNTPHMENYENQVKDYINLSGNHVRYRVTPHFERDELVARGIQLEAKSIENDDFAFNVYIFNIQDGYSIDYNTGVAKKI